MMVCTTQYARSTGTLELIRIIFTTTKLRDWALSSFNSAPQ